MRVPMFLAFLAGSFFGFVAQPMSAQTSCYTKTSDYQSCSAYTNSFGETACECAAKGGLVGNASDSLHPGVFLAQKSGKLFVDAVVLHSAAHRAGLRPGDEILMINGRDAQTSSHVGTPWYDSETRPATLAVRREHRLWTVDVASEHFDELIRTAWLAGGLQLATYVAQAKSLGVSPTQRAGSFTYGLAWASSGPYLLVTDILRGSPAFNAPLRLGDKIVSLNGVRIDRIEKQDLRALLHPEGSDELEVSIEREGSVTTLALKAAGVSAVLRELAKGQAWNSSPIEIALRSER